MITKLLTLINGKRTLLETCRVLFLYKRVYSEPITIPTDKVAVFYSPEFEEELCIEGEVIFE